jgi:hypothetical protein
MTAKWRLPNLACLVLVAACGPASGAVATPSPPASSSPSPVAVAQDLTFSGALSGHMAQGTAGDAYVCANTGGAFVAGPILGSVGTVQVEMNIAKLSFQGAGAYPADGVSFDAGSDHYYAATGAGGSLVVAADLRSGTMDIPLAANTNPTQVLARGLG